MSSPWNQARDLTRVDSKHRNVRVLYGASPDREEHAPPIRQHMWPAMSHLSRRECSELFGLSIPTRGYAHKARTLLRGVHDRVVGAPVQSGESALGRGDCGCGSAEDR